jgi:hypothetical protein
LINDSPSRVYMLAFLPNDPRHPLLISIVRPHIQIHQSIQMGSDLDRLRAGLKLLSELRRRLDAAGRQQQPQEQPPPPVAGVSGRPPALPVIGSVFLPSPGFLARLRFRPWSGVHLSADYLESVQGADQITRQIIQVYSDHGVVPIVEAELRK